MKDNGIFMYEPDVIIYTKFKFKALIEQQWLIWRNDLLDLIQSKLANMSTDHWIGYLVSVMHIHDPTRNSDGNSIMESTISLWFWYEIYVMCSLSLLRLHSSSEKTSLILCTCNLGEPSMLCIEWHGIIIRMLNRMSYVLCNKAIPPHEDEYMRTGRVWMYFGLLR